MSDQDNLRDRIADTVESAEIQWDTDFNAWQLGRPNSADPGPQPRRIAQAIIDELGLTVETHVDLGALPDHLQGVWMDDPAFREWEANQPRKTRVVGKWEQQ